MNLRNDTKGTSIEAGLFRILINALGEQGEVITSKQYWDELKNEIFGVEFEPGKYETEEYGTIRRTTVGSILEHSFGGDRKHTKAGNIYRFNRNRLDRLKSAYELDSKIKVKQVEHLEGDPTQKTQENGLKTGNLSVRLPWETMKKSQITSPEPLGVLHPLHPLQRAQKSA